MHFAKKITPEHALFFCISALFFVTPLSSSLKSIFLGLSVALVILTPSYRQSLTNLFINKNFLSVILLIIIAALSCLWSPASAAEKSLVFEKWSKLLYLPCLVVALNTPKLRTTAINAFLSAMLITCLCSIFLKITDPDLTGKITIDGVFRNHIMTSIMMSFAAYLSGLAFLNAKNLPRILYLLTTILTSAQILFVNESRTGYVIYALLIALLIIQNTSPRKAIFGIISIAAVFAASCYLSPALLERIQLVHTEWSTFQKDKNTSIGFRMQFHNFAEKLFKERPITGNGTGSFTYKFRTEDPVPAWTHNDTHSGRLLEPHSQYWLIAAEFGGIGLLAFIFFYAELAYRTYNLDKMRPIALALFIILAFGNLTDSLLFYSGSGYFFILFFALAFSEKINATQVIGSLHKSITKKHAQPLKAARN